MRAAWNTGSLISRLNAPTARRNGATGCDIPGTCCVRHSARSVSIRPKIALKKSICPLAFENACQAQAFVEVDAVLGGLIDDETDADQPVVAADGLPESPSCTINPKRARFSVEPPNASVRRLVRGEKNCPIRCPPVTVSTPSSPPSWQRLAAAAYSLTMRAISCASISRGKLRCRLSRIGDGLNCRQPVRSHRIGAPAKMRDLAHDRRAVTVMDAFGKRPQIRNDRVAGDIDLAAAPA